MFLELISPMFCSPSLRSDSSTWIPAPLSFCLGLSSLISRHFLTRGLMFFFLFQFFFFLILLVFFCKMKESWKEIRITVRMSEKVSQRRGGRIRKAFNFEWTLSDGSHVSALRVEYNEAEEKHIYLNTYLSKTRRMMNDVTTSAHVCSDS